MIVDASVALGWCLKDERSEGAVVVLRALAREAAHVPAIWPAEVANALVMAVRRGRIESTEVQGVFDLLSALPIVIDLPSWPESFERASALAQTLELSAYDAMYVELAQRLQQPLATFDTRLQRATAAAAVELWTG